MSDESREPAAPPYYPSEEPKKKGGAGCFLWGCIIAIILVVGGGTAIVGGTYYMLAKMRDKYTDTQPMPLPDIPLTSEERTAVKDRFEAFRDAVDEGRASEPLVLNQDEINTLIAESDSDDPLKDSLRVQIEDDVVTSQVSVPLDDVPFPGLKGRYFNGTAELKGSLKDGRLEVYVENASVKGESLPKNVMDELRRENLTAEIMDDPDARKTLEKLESMEIRDGKVIIVPKAVDESAEPGAAEEAESTIDAESAPETGEPAAAP